MLKIFDSALDKAYRPFVLWCVYLAGLAGAVEVARQFKVLDYIYEVDNTKLTVIIALVFLWKTLDCGRSMYSLADSADLKSRIEKTKATADSGWLWSDLVVSIGMVGTVIGFIVMLSSFENIDFEDTKSIQEMITKLGYGMSTALSTTLVGLIASVFLKVQYFKLDELVKRNEEKLSL